MQPAVCVLQTRPLTDNAALFSGKPMQRRHHAIPLSQAAQESPTLARLADVARASSERLAAVRDVLPAALRTHIQAGPLEDSAWCLLVPSTAVAAKLRQFIPTLQAQLNNRGLAVASIRIKVLGRSM